MVRVFYFDAFCCLALINFQRLTRISESGVLFGASLGSGFTLALCGEPTIGASQGLETKGTMAERLWASLSTSPIIFGKKSKVLQGSLKRGGVSVSWDAAKQKIIQE